MKRKHINRKGRPLKHPDDLRTIGGAEMRFWRTSKLGLSYKDLFYRGEMVRIDPGVQDIVRFLNEEMNLTTVGSSDHHGDFREPAWVIVSWWGGRKSLESEMKRVISREFNRKGNAYYITDGGTTLTARFGGIGLRIMVKANNDGNMVRGWNEWKARFRKWFGQ